MHSKKEKINDNLFLLRTWQVDQPKANVLIVHGYAEHSARYEETASKLNEEGYSVYAFDRRGEGESEGKRAIVNNFAVQVHDMKQIIGMIEKKDVKLFLYGHSLGGLIVTKYIVDYDAEGIDGFILSGPLLMPDEDMSPFLQKIAGLVGRLLPFLPVVNLDSSLLSQDVEEVKAYDADPLVYHGSTKARTAFEFLRTMKFVQKRFHSIRIPFLVMHGSADKITNPKGSQMLYNLASSEDKTIRIFDGWYHEIMREPKKEMFFNSMLSWLKERV
ncbi:MAG: lysophospholipase [Saprospiraceae bacterium]|nr:lysophospholipase [Saprospiraceae bacterium]